MYFTRATWYPHCDDHDDYTVIDQQDGVLLIDCDACGVREERVEELTPFGETEQTEQPQADSSITIRENAVLSGYHDRPMNHRRERDSEDSGYDLGEW